MTRSSTSFDPSPARRAASLGPGMAWTGAAQAMRLACQIVSVVVMSRLLDPADFGLLAMCAPVLAFVALFQNLGLTQATIQKRSVTHEEVTFLFWVSVGVACGLGALLVLVAPLIALFYGEPRTAPLTAALALPLIAYGMSSQHYALLNRAMRFGILAAIECVAVATGLVVGIGWAMVSPSVWALYAGTLAAAVSTTGLFWAASAWLPGRPRRVEGAGGLLRFGAGVTGFGVANFVSRNADNVLIGRVWGDVALGFYSRAYRLLLFPLQQVNTPVAKVMLPTLSRLTDEPTAYRATFLRVQGLVAIVAVPGVVAMIAMADTLVPLALGPKWAPVVPIFAALGFAGLFQPLNGTAHWLLVSQGRTDEYVRLGVVTAFWSLGAFAIGIRWGPVGLAAAYAASEALRTPFVWWYVGRSGPVGWRDTAGTLGPILVGAAAAYLAIAELSSLLAAIHPVLRLAAALACSYATVALVMAAFPAGRAILLDVTRMPLRILADRFRPAVAR